MARQKDIAFQIMTVEVEPWWEELTDEELLKVRLCELDLDLEGTWVERAFTQVKTQLAGRGLGKLNPSIWLSTDWFCPDEHAGFAVPFYLVHPRLAVLTEAVLGEAEGANWEWCLKLMRHELGHVVENAYPKVAKSALRESVFGSNSVPYPKTYTPKPYSRNYVRHLEAGYAQAHPTEDFAETFAVWLTGRKIWLDRYASGVPHLKLKTIEALIEHFVYGSAPRGFRCSFEPLHRSKETLGQFLRARLCKLGCHEEFHRERQYELSLDRIIGEKHSFSAKRISELWRAEQKQLVERLQKEFQIPRYQVKAAVQPISAQIHERRNLYVFCDRIATNELYRLARSACRRYHKGREHQIPI